MYLEGTIKSLVVNFDLKVSICATIFIYIHLMSRKTNGIFFTEEYIFFQEPNQK